MTPSVGGFTLAPAFGGIKVDIPSALVWPTTAGAAPLLLERTGRVVQLGAGAKRTVLDFSSAVALVSEGGALGIALHPQFGDGTGPSPHAFVWYNTPGAGKNRQRLARFTWSAVTNAFDRASELVLLEEEEEQPEHNAGHIQFGPDGFLYFGNGDDSNGANHQRLDRALFAGIFRIDVDSRGAGISHAPTKQPAGGYSQGYFIPDTNPFVGIPGAMEEFYALGLRNPFGFSFDKKTGELWAADVGDTWREEVDLVVAGGNYEWPNREGEVVRVATATTIGTARGPKFAYSHAEMGDLTAALGGYVYRGSELPELTGQYVYSDWPSCRVWALDLSKTPAARRTLVDNQSKCMPMALAEDPQGELYVLHFDGITKLVRDPSKDLVPTQLTGTLLFADVAGLKPAAGFVPYDVSSPLWSDGAAKQRWIRVPAGQQVTLAADGSLALPVGTTFLKQFDLPASVTPQGRGRRLETRVMVVGSQETYGLTYRWNAAGTDAVLVTDPTDEPILDSASQQTRTWHYPSFGQCWSCHRSENRILGFTGPQLARKTADGKEQLAQLAAAGVFSNETIAKMPPGLTRPSDTSASLEARATAYLAANCGSCHHAGASYLGGNETWIATPGVSLGDRGLVGAPHHNLPMARALGLPGAPLVAPGSPEGSLLLARVKSNDPDLRMPPLARQAVDPEGVQLLEEWIRSIVP